MKSHPRASESLFHALAADGRWFIHLTGLALIFSGGFAIFLSATGSFLPHDVAFLGMQPAELCAINECRIVHFMFHDRVSFGGVLISIGVMYVWLAEFPLKDGEPWAWWTLAASGAVGFASFLSYLSYGYLDTWHGIATLFLLPCFVLGMVLTFRTLPTLDPCVKVPTPFERWPSRACVGRVLLVLTGLGMVGAGFVILAVGMFWVFVPQDLTYIGLTRDQLDAINPRLIPLIAHDRAGFGGGLLSSGICVLSIGWKAPLTRSLWETLLLGGSAGFVCAIGVHYPIGYTDITHLAPAWAGFIVFVWSVFLLRGTWHPAPPNAAATK
jgi:hypothetical protein